MTELTLNDDQRHAFASELDGQASAMPDQQRAAAVIGLGFGKSKRFLKRRPARQRITIRARSRGRGRRHRRRRVPATISSTFGESAG